MRQNNAGCSQAGAFGNHVEPATTGDAFQEIGSMAEPFHRLLVSVLARMLTNTGPLSFDELRKQLSDTYAYMPSDLQLRHALHDLNLLGGVQRSKDGRWELSTCSAVTRERLLEETRFQRTALEAPDRLGGISCQRILPPLSPPLVAFLSTSLDNFIETRPTSVRLRNAIGASAAEGKLPFATVYEYLDAGSEAIDRLRRLPNLGRKTVAEFDALIRSEWNQVGRTRNGVLPSAGELASALAEAATPSAILNADTNVMPEDSKYKRLECCTSLSWPASLTPESLDEEQWRVLAARIRAHGLDKYPIARFARSLMQLPRSLWHELLSSFTQRSLAEIRRVSGYGETRVRQVLEIAIDLGTFLSSLPGDTHYKVQVLPASIRDLMHWVEQVLADEEVPSVEVLRTNFVLPLMQQLHADLGPNVSEMVKRRLGIDGPPETLDEVATDFDLTRERIRQLTLRAPEVLKVRWPEGKHILDDFYEKFRDTPRAHEQVDIVRRCLDLLFAISATAATSYADVLAEWEALGGRKQTPMNAAEIRAWLATVFPHLSPQIGYQWIAQEAKSFESERYGVLYFSNDELDLLLYDLYKRGAPTELSEILDLDGTEERNMRGRISRDIRIIQDEHKRLLPAEYCGFYRDSGEWRIELAAVRHPSGPRQDSIIVADLAHLTVSGLLQAGIADATVWGVHRYANEMLAGMFDAKLPDEVTPFILADSFVGLSNGIVRPMRRRRLRWDAPGTGIPARGKRGWVGYVLSENGMPVTVEELGDLLRSYYQDYASYVLAQLNLDAEEEGDYHCSAVWYSGIPHRIPPILYPADWKLDAKEDNISSEIKILISKIIAMARDKSLKRQDLAAVPWLIELADRHTYGEDIWQDRRLSVDQDREVAASPETCRIEGHASNGHPVPRDAVVARPRSTSEVDELLSKFL